MTTKLLLSLLSRHETLKTPSNFRKAALRIGAELVDTGFNPRHAERFLEIVPWNMRQAMAALIVDTCRTECGTRGIREPKGGIAQRIDKCLARIRENAETAQAEFDEALGAPCMAEASQESVRRRA